MRTSFRLTPSAHRKNRVVTRISGVPYRRSVMGAEVVISYVKVRSRCTHPPSTNTCWPVMCAARTESRNTTIAAISWGEVILVSRGFRTEALIPPLFDGCRQRGHRRHARTAQSDHSIDVLGARLGRHINVPHLRERCHWRVVIGEPLEE